MPTTPAVSVATLRVLFISPSPNSQVDRTISLHGNASLSPGSGKFLKLNSVTVDLGNSGPPVKAVISGISWYCNVTIAQNVPLGTAIVITANADVAYIPQGFPPTEPDEIMGSGTLNVILGTVTPPLINVRLFSEQSSKAQHPTVDVTVPATYKVIGGGAYDDWTGAGNLLTASYPLDPRTWRASGKDHEIADPSVITAYALAIEDPNDEWDVNIVSHTSAVAAHPVTTVELPAGYVLTGGGAFVDYHGQGNMLTASFPATATSWQAQSKDHDLSDPAAITAYVIGISHKPGTITIKNSLATLTSGVAAHPAETVSLDPGWILSGGGACDQYNNGAGNLLTASYPVSPTTWYAAGKDHVDSSPASMIVTVIGIQASAS